MSHYVVFNLDELSSSKFQELCNVLLLKYFSELIRCMVRPGRDGQCDGSLDGLPISYSELINTPFKSQSPCGRDVIWFFQAKHTQMGDDTLRQKAILSALKTEIVQWKKRKKEERPTHYILLTNVNLKLAVEQKILSLGKGFFDYFEVWHESKISCFIAGDVAIQKAFYPHRSTSLDLLTKDDLKKLTHIMSHVKPTVISAQLVQNFDLDTKDVEGAIRALVEYEIRFQKTNEFFWKQLKITKQSEVLPKEWKSYAHVAKGNGVLVLSENIEELQRFTDKIARNEVHVTIWDGYLGKEVSEGDTIITLACDPGIMGQIAAHLDSIFTIMPSENQAYRNIDRYLRELESGILNNIKNSKIQDVQDGLRHIYHIRQTYAFFKADYSNAFYPNNRRFAGEPSMVWDFINLWECIFRNIYDVAFADKIPESLSDLLLSIPFMLCSDVIRERRSKESFQAVLETLKIPLVTIVKKNDKSFSKMFLDKLENLSQEVADIDCHIESFEQAEWAAGIIIEMTQYIANLGWQALSEKIPQLPFDQLDKTLMLATSASFKCLLTGKDHLKEKLERQKDLQKAITLVKSECLFAWATFVWYSERNKGLLDPILTVNLLKKIQMSDIVLFYGRNKFDRSGWINEWFIPEGKRVSWSWAMDHDIRESLQLAILHLPIKSDDFVGLES